MSQWGRVRPRPAVGIPGLCSRNPSPPRYARTIRGDVWTEGAKTWLAHARSQKTWGFQFPRRAGPLSTRRVHVSVAPPHASAHEIDEPRAVRLRLNAACDARIRAISTGTCVRKRGARGREGGPGYAIFRFCLPFTQSEVAASDQKFVSQTR